MFASAVENLFKIGCNWDHYGADADLFTLHLQSCCSIYEKNSLLINGLVVSVYLYYYWFIAVSPFYFHPFCLLSTIRYLPFFSRFFA